MHFFKKALPVWAENLKTEMNITMGFYTLVEGCENATLRLATSGFYRVFVNGEFVNYGPARCAHGHYRVDELTLPLKKGENHVAVEVVNYYINSFASLRQAGFIQMELEADGKILAATGNDGFKSFLLTERVRKLQRFSYQRPMSESYRLSPDVYNWRVGEKSENATAVKIEEVEAKNLLSRGISYFNFPVAVPEKRISRGKFVVNEELNKNAEKPRGISALGDPAKGFPCGFAEDELGIILSEETKKWQITENNPINDLYSGETELSAGEFENLALVGEKTGFITANIICKKAGTLYFAVDERITKDMDVDPNSMGCMNAIRFDVKEGEYPFRSVEAFGFKYAKIVCISGEFCVKNFSVTELVCAEKILAEYKGESPKLTKVFNAAVETFKQNAVDIFMDCPTRERAGWLCDSFFTARTERALTGKNTVERNFLENYCLPESFEFLPKGMVPMCYPSDALLGEFIPNWAMWLVVELEDYLLRTGDKDFVLTFKKRVYDLLDYFEGFENSDGLLEKLKNWVFVEWSEANNFVQDINFPSNMMYYKMLLAAANMFDDNSLVLKAEKLKEVIKKRSFNGEFFTDNEVYKDGKAVSTGNRSETCQYYAFFTGVATIEEYPELWNKLLTEFGPERIQKGLYPEIWPSNAFIGNFLRLELLLREGKYQQLLDECVGYFEYMADRTGTLWENQTDNASCNHGFASYAAVFILEAEKHI